jgi:ribosomal protein L12E/L44/L45/RPP1/RPP2
MRVPALLFTAILVASPSLAQQAPASAVQQPASADQDKDQDKKDTKNDKDASSRELNLPVSLDKIREGLQQTPAISLRALDERPTFRIQIRERQKIEELLASLNFKAGPVPAGGVYMYEQQRQMFNPVDRPLMQPYAAFGPGQLLTILIENLVGKYLAGKAGSAISNADRARAEANAREEVRAAVAQYCNAQPNLGVGIQICDTGRD